MRPNSYRQHGCGNDTNRDFLNFTGVSDTVVEIIVQAQGKPISIGVSGAWGAGKSSMIRLVRAGLEQRAEGKRSDFIFVEFNAWLYQGYDDARAALMEVIATALAKEAEQRRTGLEKAKELLQRVNWFRAVKLGAGSALARSLRLPRTGILNEAIELGKKIAIGNAGADDIAKAEGTVTDAASKASGLIKPRTESSPPKETHAIRKSCEETLEVMGTKLIVLIDDLDRCLPQTTISTLEAVRLFLFLENTAFVIAADDSVIRHAVRRHFDGIVDEGLVTSYFDKLIQVPIRVPPLGTQEVRAYLMLLFVENSTGGPFAQTDGVPLLPWQVNDAERRIAEIWGAPLEEVQHVLHNNLRMLGGFKRSSQHRLCLLMAATRQALLPAFASPESFLVEH
ncbi:P-loop NTPase fold protein [Bradyrhizobium sp. sGM-13]|uniref:KAP family P-loop NTPase fold protein n=1 Tax=Bradyrhizobium sp. sGM-13 TaxID=2831781 RepID=UPI001BD13394|nr:P-loop NTPase fold protein [Bradyrhizobium sp. sGM-13]